jgi:aminobenzoyl-glutamate utilization protein B
MNTLSFLRNGLLLFVIILVSSSLLYSQKKEQSRTGKPDMYKEKNDALEYLEDSLIIRKYGLISNKIWNYAELGMQEFRSSALLIKTLEEEGFKVDKGVAGMPTCFVGTWGSGKPVIGILGEFDAKDSCCCRSARTRLRT